MAPLLYLNLSVSIGFKTALYGEEELGDNRISPYAYSRRGERCRHYKSRGFTEIGYVPKSRVIFKKNR